MIRRRDPVDSTTHFPARPYHVPTIDRRVPWSHRSSAPSIRGASGRPVRGVRGRGPEVLVGRHRPVTPVARTEKWAADIASAPAVDTQPAPELQASIVDGVSPFLSLEADWRSLYDRIASPSPFLCWEWVSEWAAHFWDERLITVVVRRSGAPIAIAPFTPYRGLPLAGLRYPGLELMGPRRGYKGSMFELAEALVDPEVPVPAFITILRCLAERRSWHWIDVGGCAEAGDWWRSASEYFPENMKVVRENVMPNAVVELPADWETALRELGANFRRNIKRSYRDLAQSGFAVEYREHRDVDALESLLDTLFRFHSARAHMEGRPFHYDIFAYADSRRFIRSASRRLMECGVLSVGNLSINGEPAALRFQLEGKGRLFFYHSGFDQRFWKYGVSAIEQVEALKSAIAKGCTLANFGLGVGDHTDRWRPQIERYERLWLVRKSRRSLATLAFYERLGSSWRRARAALTRVRRGRKHKSQRSSDG